MKFPDQNIVMTSAFDENGVERHVYITMTSRSVIEWGDSHVYGMSNPHLASGWTKDMYAGLKNIHYYGLEANVAPENLIERLINWENNYLALGHDRLNVRGAEGWEKFVKNAIKKFENIENKKAREAGNLEPFPREKKKLDIPEHITNAKPKKSLPKVETSVLFNPPDFPFSGAHNTVSEKPGAFEFLKARVDFLEKQVSDLIVEVATVETRAFIKVYEKFAKLESRIVDLEE